MGLVESVVSDADADLAASIVLVYIFVSLFFQFIMGIQCIVMKKHDYIGGVAILGYVFCASAILIPAVILIPVFTYRIFSQAEDYSLKYGFLEE
ncbi:MULTISPECIES: hypothetical protein [unclassified Dysgonomonas]|uniref:hypothetical protein n=1 Tax=unclassified Dysgonomonas TaxID=2630389 RepID=UPI0024732BB9|nr:MULTISPECIES: hypothetical protein [unclassified Dysgonomonas]